MKKILLIPLVLMLAACGKKDHDVAKPTPSDLAAKAEGYDVSWFCVGKDFEDSNENLVVTLSKKNDGSGKYFLSVENKLVNWSPNSLSISTKGLFHGSQIKVLEDEKVSVVSTDYGSVSDPIAVFSKTEGILMMTLPGSSRIEIDCKANKIQ